MSASAQAFRLKPAARTALKNMSLRPESVAPGRRLCFKMESLLQKRATWYYRGASLAVISLHSKSFGFASMTECPCTARNWSGSSSLM